MSEKKPTDIATPTDGMNLVRMVCQALSEKKGDNIVVLDIRGHSTLADYLVLVSGSSPPHIKAMRNDLLLVLKKQGVACYRKAGEPDSGWLILDYSDVVVHLFLPRIRAYYALEELWPGTARTEEGGL